MVESTRRRMSMDRLKVLQDLIAFKQPTYILSGNLSKFDWDYDGQPMILKITHIKEVLKRFLAGEFSSKELEDWANLIECREDIELEEHKRDEIKNVIHCLANPTLQGEITTHSCEALLNKLTCSLK